MARVTHKLTALMVSKAKEPGLYGDGAGLWLQIAAGGSKSWLFRYRRDGKGRAMGLGACHTVSLAEAREAALQARKQLLAGIDPIEARRGTVAAKAAEKARVMTFGQCAEAYIIAHRPSWRNADHSMQWQSSLRNYVLPIIGQLNVADIDTAHVMKCLEPIWTEKTETASRVRGRVELVLDWAAARGFRKGENPARWKGHIQNLLPKTSKTKKVAHHAALPYTEIGGLMAELEPLRSSAAWALRFLILTAARTGEVLKATWDEIDLDRGMWTIPGERMKSGREHRVALSKAAVALLKDLPHDGAYVFPGPSPDRPMHHLSMRLVLKGLGRDNITVHGFRSTFRDWAAEQTNFPRELAEMALAHSVGDKTEAAYRRSDLFEKRRKLADAWASFIAKPAATGNVTPIRAVVDAAN